jgi:rhamnosyl/mannosyltransferase
LIRSTENPAPDAADEPAHSSAQSTAQSAADDFLAGLTLTSEGVEAAARSLREKSGEAPQESRTLRRDWGSEAILFEAERIRIRRLELEPGAQMIPPPGERSQHWVVAEGRAIMSIGAATAKCGPDESRYLPPGAPCRLANPGRMRLVVVELAYGDRTAAGEVASLSDGRRPAPPPGIRGGGRPLRVVHVYKTFLPDSYGGLENAIGQMAVAARRLGIETRVLSISPSGVPRVDSYRGSDHYRYRQTASLASNTMSLSMLSDFGRHVAWADVIHYHFPWPFADLLHLAWRVRKPSVLTYHSDIVRQRRLMALYRPLMNAFLQRIDRIVATSPNYVQTSDVLQGFTAKTTVIPIGLDPASYPATRAEALARWRAELGENFFLFIGVIRYYKGLHILLDALAKAPLPTVIVGSGPIEAELRRHAERAGLRHVRFLGTVSEEDKVALLELSAAVVFPSHLRSEAFGVTLLEGAMFGKPLISSEIGTGTSYINIDGETGIVVPASDPDALRAAMLRLDADAPLRARMGAQAQRRFEQLFTAERMAARYAQTYREMVGRTAVSGAAVSVHR